MLSLSVSPTYWYVRTSSRFLSLSLSLAPPSSGLLTLWGMARALSCCSSALVCVCSLLQQENLKPQKLGLPPGAPTTVIVCIHAYIYTYIRTYTFNAQIQRALTLSLTQTHTTHTHAQTHTQCWSDGVAHDCEVPEAPAPAPLLATAYTTLKVA